MIIEKKMKMQPNNDQDETSLRLESAIYQYVKLGLIIVGCFIGFFLFWGIFAPIDSAVIAHGTVVFNDNRKVVQHLQGGIIEELLVKDGDIVEKGQPLIKLSKVQAKAKLQSITNQYYSKRITEQRLLSARNFVNNFELPDEIKDKISDNPEIENNFKSELNLLKSQIDTFQSQVDLYQQQISLANDRTKSLELQLAASESQKSLAAEELKNVEQLYAKQLVQKTRLLNLKKELAQNDGRIAEYQSQINSVKESINEVKLKIEQLKTNFTREIDTELKDVVIHLSSMKEEMDAAKDIEERTIISSTENGIITSLKYHTVGGIISPGTVIMEIAPMNGNLIVEAQILPKDIDVVHVGQPTKIMIVAFKARFTPRIDGILDYISADRITDEKTGMAYYIARVKIDHDELKKLGKILLPGMPAEVFIVTGERSFLQYFLSPITNSFHKAFKEE